MRGIRIGSVFFLSIDRVLTVLSDSLELTVHSNDRPSWTQTMAPDDWWIGADVMN
jgi:hypothetical protein